MRYKYYIEEYKIIDPRTMEKEAMSLKKLIKGLDPKITFIVQYHNKKGNLQKKIIKDGKHSDYNSTIFDSVG